MSQHKYNDAYNKGFEDGKKKAFDDWVYQCYDELSPKEQIELLLSEGAELPRKAVLQALEDVKAETERQYKWLFNTKYTRYDVDIAFNSIFRIIDKYRNKAESGDKE